MKKLNNKKHTKKKIDLKLDMSKLDLILIERKQLFSRLKNL